MQTYKQQVSLPLPYPMEELCPLEELLFFDIETTGFQADVSSLYLIGCIIYENDSFQMYQWFADDYRSEADLLHAFFEIVATRHTLIHFNGDGFDIPYIKKKCEQHHLTYSFDACRSIDLYKKITPYKKILKLPNYKQKTIEQFLKINRTDPYTGGQLISVYVEYMKARFGYRDTSAYLAPLLLHNKEDLKGMIELLKILHYIDIFEVNLNLVQASLKNNYVEFELATKIPLPSELVYHENYLYLEARDTKVIIRIAYYYGELKFFYKNYKEYYYLKEEDMAVHKSVAEYVDKEFREKAKASNCYVRKTALFLPCAHYMSVPCYRYNYYDKQQFIEITKEWLGNKNLLLLYLKELLKTIG